MTFDFFTIEGLKYELVRYGLKLEERVMPVAVLILEEDGY